MIYADNASTTRLSDTVLEKMLPFLKEQYGNASSAYSFGAKAKRAIENARSQIANAINANLDDIYFTSGGSESNSWVISSVKSGHVVTSAFEHHSVLNACQVLENYNVQVTYVSPDKDGRVSSSDVLAAIRPDTKLVSLMLANNEIGTIQPIAEVAQSLKREDILFHTDAVQAVGHIPVDVNALGVDCLSASAHKFNGAKGTGILYIRHGVELPSIVFGGEQERGRRAGTEDTSGIVGMGYALEENVHEMEANRDKLMTLVQKTFSEIQRRISCVYFSGVDAERLPGILNISFGDVSGESLIHLLDLKGICVSTGSACTSGKSEPSHVLKAIGLSEEQALSAIRISYGRYNSLSDIEEIVDAVCDAYQKVSHNSKTQK